MTVGTIKDLCKQEIDEIIYYDDKKNKEYDILGKEGIKEFFEKHEKKLVYDCMYKPSDKKLYIHII